MGFRSNFRDVKEWSASTGGVMRLNTVSDAAAKHYDQAVSQFCGWYNDPQAGGAGHSVAAMLRADPDFLLGRALEVQLELLGGLNAPHLDPLLAAKLAAMNELAAAKGSASEHELLHVRVANELAGGRFKEATVSLERLLTLYPEDVAALKVNQDTYFVLGTALPMRNSLASSLHSMSPANPLKGYAHGMYAFALEESNMYPQSQAEALRALELVPRDTWAIHTYAHCLEMQARTSEGLKWMEERRADWEPCQVLACHQNWHTALFHINAQHLDAAVDLLDQEVLSRCVAGSSTLDMHDAASMIYRMELADIFARSGQPASNQHKRWQGVYDMALPHKTSHLVGFNDAHFMMSFLGMDDLKAARELLDTIDEAPGLRVGRTVVRPLLEAMYQFKLQAYETCVDILEPIRFEIIHIGGSHAQRDVFEQLLLVAALKSARPAHNKLAQRMLAERDAMQGHRTHQTSLLADMAR